MVHEMPLKLYFMKCSERKISQCILPFRKISLISKFMTTPPGYQTFTIDILPNTHELEATRQ